MERIAAPVIELIWRKVVDSFSSTAVDQMADHALNNVQNIADFEPIFTNLKKNLKSLSAKAADVEEEITTREVSGQKKRKREVKEWLEEVETIKQVVVELGSQIESEGFVMRLTDGGKAAQLDKQVKELVEQSHNFGELVLDVRRTSGDKFLIDGMVGEAFSENLERIMELLENREVSSIGVHGMGGVGKTTLAKHINNRLLQQAEGRVLWVTVSQEFTIKSLQDKLAHLLGVNLSEKDEDDVRAKRLHGALTREKNSVLILDDAWEYIDMKKVGCYFPVDGCRVIVTTRSLEVCHRMRCERVIRVEKLGEEEAWKLFSETLGDEIKLGPEVEGVAKSVAKMCDGLPLGIITVAGSMRGEKVIHSWKNALTELEESLVGQEGMGDIKVFKVLKYSFDRLKRNGELESNEFNMIQQCFLYCSLYPEDHKILKHDLVKRFISDGLVGGKRSRRAQVEQGLTILDKLVKLCLLESCVNYKNVEYVKMHDLVRSMALRICKGKYMVRAGDYSLKELPNEEEEWTQGLEKVSFMKCDIRRIEEGISPDCPKLSTLLLQWNTKLKVIPESFVYKMQGLCTLDMGGNSEIVMLPDSISELTCLKSLLLEKCKSLEKVPYLGKMKALRELNLSGTAIKEAPQGLEELVNLRFLSMNADGLKMLPSGVFLKLEHLQHLELPSHIQVSTEEMEGMKQLEEFNGGVENVSGFNWFIATPSVHGTCTYTGRVNPKHGIKQLLTFSKDLGGENNRMEMSCFDLEEEKILGQGIVHLTISRCEGVSKWLVDNLWERFDNSTSLKSLDISECKGIEWIMRSEDGQLLSTLEKIELWGLDDLKGVVGVMERERGGLRVGAAAAQPHVFSSLKRLCIEECKKMRKLGLPVVSALPSLEEINIRNCEEVEEIFEEEEEDEGRDSATTLPKLRELELQNLPRLRKVGLPASRGVPNLEVINISQCGEIEEVFEKEKEDEGRDSATTLPKLTRLNLYNLARLRKVGLPAASGVPNLEKIRIIWCGEIQEIFEEEDGGRAAADPTLPKLRMLWLSDLPSLKRVSKATIISNPIQTIWITKCPELMNKLPLHFIGPVPPPSRKDIWVEREWWESLEWDNPLLPQLLRPFLRLRGS